MTPFDVLGVPRNCSIEDAKAAYRRLASVNHPDKGGVTKRFQDIQGAWDKIENGYRYVEPAASTGFSEQPPPFKSSFTPGATPYTTGKTAGKPAPGYEARRGPPLMPQTTRAAHGQHNLVIELTQDQAFEGCTFPFIHNRAVYEYIVRPGTFARNEQAIFPFETQIGLSCGSFTVNIEVRILNQHSNKNEQSRDAEMELPLCALALFIGGRVSVADHLGELVVITIEPGQDQDKIFKFPNHGYGNHGNRGTLLVKIKPVFKTPASLNQHELQQLQRLNEMTK
jgi:curved DNA-binding protein CbpA